MQFILLFYIVFMVFLYADGRQGFTLSVTISSNNIHNGIKQKEDKVLKLDNEKKLQDVDLNFELSRVAREYKKWKKINTGTYTYICRTNTFMGRNSEAILAVKNNVIVRRMILPRPRSKIFSLHQNFHFLKNEKEINLLSTRRDRGILRAHLACNIDDIFNDILSEYYKKSFYDNFKINIIYNTKYSFISDIIVKKIPNKIYSSKHARSWDIHLSDMLILSKDTQFTDNTMRIILNKYKQAWEYEKKLLAASKTNNEHNLTLLEKAVGKEKLECLDKYLVWDENESK